MGVITNICTSITIQENADKPYIFVLSGIPGAVGLEHMGFLDKRPHRKQLQ